MLLSRYFHIMFNMISCIIVKLLCYYVILYADSYKLKVNKKMNSSQLEYPLCTVPITSVMILCPKQGLLTVYHENCQFCRYNFYQILPQAKKSG